MAWKCRCGKEGPPNPKGVLGFVMLDSCFDCRTDFISPHILEKESGGDTNKYIQSMLAHGYIKPKHSLDK